MGELSSGWVRGVIEEREEDSSRGWQRGALSKRLGVMIRDESIVCKSGWFWLIFQQMMAKCITGG
jgi:hypothetical protein